MRQIASVFVALSLISCATEPTPATRGFVLEGLGPGDRNIVYFVQLPKGTAAGAGRWPLLVFLHGRGESGGGLRRVAVHGPIKASVGMDDFPFLVVAPHLPVDVSWDPEWVTAVVGDAMSRWPVDRDRVYLTGLSLGGHGTWDTAARYPDMFAAIAPVSGRGDQERACSLAGLPIWSFHGVLDDIVAASDNQAMVDAVRRCGGEPGLTLYPDTGHDAWTGTYDDPRLYAWLLSHSRND